MYSKRLNVLEFPVLEGQLPEGITQMFQSRKATSASPGDP